MQNLTARLFWDAVKSGYATTEQSDYLPWHKLHDEGMDESHTALVASLETLGIHVPDHIKNDNAKNGNGAMDP